MSRFILKLSLIVLNALFLFSRTSHAESSPKIILEAGQTEVLSIASGSTVTVSPKNLLEVEAAGKGKIRLIGLRSGIALVKAVSESSEQTFLVEILSRDSQGDWLQRTEWRSFFCAREGVQCDIERKVISGRTNDLKWFFEAKKLCKSKMPCTWNVGLTDTSRLNAENELKRLFPELGFHLDRDGQIRIESVCDEKDRKRLEQVMESVEQTYAVPPQVQCLLRSPDLWLLDVLVIAEREGSGEISNPLRWERIELPSSEPLRAYIAELSQDSRLRIVANPELSLSLGGTALLKDGQEIQTLAIQKDSEEILWKQSGFRLELKFLEMRGGLARIQIHMNLSQPQAGLRTIDSSEFASEVWIPQNQLLRVGRLQAKLQGNAENRIPWLSAIPFLGALFRWESDSSAKSQVEVMLRIRPGVLISETTGKDDWPGTESKTLSPAVPEG